MSSRLGEILRRRGVLTAEQLALAARSDQPGTLAGELVRLGLVSEEALLRALADEYGLPVVDPRAAAVPRAALDAVPHSVARRQLLVPVDPQRTRPDRGECHDIPPLRYTLPCVVTEGRRRGGTREGQIPSWGALPSSRSPKTPQNLLTSVSKSDHAAVERRNQSPDWNGHRGARR